MAFMVTREQTRVHLYRAVGGSFLPFICRVGSGSKWHRELQGMAAWQNRELDHLPASNPPILRATSLGPPTRMPFTEAVFALLHCDAPAVGESGNTS